MSDLIQRLRTGGETDDEAMALMFMAADRITELEAENTTLLDLHSKAMKSLTSQVLKRRELEAANAKMRKCLEEIAEHHEDAIGEILPTHYHTDRRDFAREAAK